MQTVEEKYAELLGEAEKALAEAPEAWSAVCVRTAEGQIFTAARAEGTEETRKADDELSERLRERQTRVTELVCLCRGGALEVPGKYLSDLLRDIDPENAAATVLLRGKTLTERTI